MLNRLARSAVVLAAFAIAASVDAQAPLVVPGSFSILADASGVGASGTQEVFVRDGDVRVEAASETGDGFVVLFAQGEGGYVLRAYEGASTEPTLEVTLDDILADDDLYAGIASLMIFFLNPASPIHPCEHTPPEDGVLTGDFEVWDCAIVGSEMIGGRSTTVWTFEVIWGREGRPAIFNDPIQTMWIDDELGLPVAYDGGPDAFRTELIAVDPSRQDEALFTGR
jgi:hypothetical protein